MSTLNFGNKRPNHLRLPAFVYIRRQCSSVYLNPQISHFHLRYSCHLCLTVNTIKVIFSSISIMDKYFFIKTIISKFKFIVNKLFSVVSLLIFKKATWTKTKKIITLPQL